jgi:hypothetical protein
VADFFSRPAELTTMHNITAVGLSGQEKLRYFVENRGFLNYARKLKEDLKECPKKTIFMRSSDDLRWPGKGDTENTDREKKALLQETL